jgi:predicted lipoprotein
MKIPNRTIIVEVHKGAVVNVFANGNKAVLVVDHDSEGRPIWLQVDSPANMGTELDRLVARKLKDLA